MSVNQLKYLNVSDGVDLEPYVAKLLNKILYCRKRSGRTFLSKLVSVNGDLLVFEDKSGRITIDNLSDIAAMSEVV